MVYKQFYNSPHGILRLPVHFIPGFDIVYFIEQRHSRQRNIGPVLVQRVRVGFQLCENRPPVYLLPVLVRKLRIKFLKRHHPQRRQHFIPFMVRIQNHLAQLQSRNIRQIFAQRQLGIKFQPVASRRQLVLPFHIRQFSVINGRIAWRPP